MKKFRNNLHSAFFFPGSNEYSTDPHLNESYEESEDSETEEVIEQTQQDLVELKEDVTTESETSSESVRPSKDVVTTYDVDPNHHESDDGENGEIESVKTRKMVKFLAHELPNYLWGVKDKNFIQKIGGIPLISNVKVDAPSFEDKKQIEAFIKAADKLNGENPELALLNVFKTLETGAKEEEIKQELEKNGVTLKKEKYIKRIKKAFDFYCSTQLTYNSIDNQHALYLSILQIVQKQGGFDATMDAFKKDVADYKERKDKEGKEYRKGEKLDANYKAFAEVLGVQDFTSATRLSEKGAEYFKDKKVVDILADLNNDGTINFADKGLKTGAQFKEIYEMVGEDVALPNLLAQAKLLNATLTNAEGISIPDEEFTPEQIQGGNKKLILLLQSIISNPGQDLNKILRYGPDAEERDRDLHESLQNPESADDPIVQESARIMLEGIDLSDIKADNVQVASSEGLHQAVAGALYAEYTRGAGIGAKIPFDQWVKGLSLNGGLQVSDSGVSIGLNLAYNREIDLGKGWSITPGASIGFIPMFKFGEGFSNPNWMGSAGVELAKQWLSKHNVHQKVGGRVSFTEVFGVAHVYSAFVGWERDKAKGIEEGREGMKKEFNEKITTPLLEEIANSFGDKAFDLNESENVVLVEKAVDKTVERVLKGEKTKFNNADIQRLKQNIIRYLINYNKAPIASKEVRQMISNEMSEQYSYAWAEQRMNDINGKTYLAGARAGFSWVQLGALGMGVLHAGLTFKTQSADMYGDALVNNSKIEALEGYTWTQDMIDHLNQYLLVSPEAKFSLRDDGYIVIPKKAISECDIRINPKMKGLIKKDEKGNILLSNETYMNLPEVLLGGARKSVYLKIGGGDEVDSVKLQSIDDSWFTEGDIEVSKLPGKENPFTKENMELRLDSLKQKCPKDELLQNFHFDESFLAELEQGRKYLITLQKTGEGMVVSKTEVNSGLPLQIEYKGTENIELMSEEARIVAEEIYKEANKVASNALYNISHDKNNRLNAGYKKFAYEVRDQKYDEAKSTILDMLPKMQKYINQYQNKNNQIDFSKNGENEVNVIKTLQNLEGAELGKALMSINNVFARVSSVHGGADGEYHFKRYDSSKEKLVDRTMGDIIEARAKEISRKIDNSSLDEEAKAAYKNLISFAEQDRVNNPVKYKVTSKKGETLNNAIGINLGNAINIENPLFNPEVYSDSVIDNVKFEGKDVLMKRALTVVANNKALIDPIKTALHIEGDVSVVGYDDQNGQLNLDIDGKNVILKANMKFAYFAQCVNHMLILDNIQAEVPGGEGSVNFGPYVMGDGAVSEATVRTFSRTSRTTVDVAATIIREKPDDEPKKPEYKDGSDPSDGEKPDTTIPETDGRPIGSGRDNPPDNPDPDNVWTDGNKRGGDDPDSTNQGDL